MNNEAYTPAALCDTIVRRILHHYPHTRHCLWVDPHAGEGAFLEAFKRAGLCWYGATLDPKHATSLQIDCRDFLQSKRTDYPMKEHQGLVLCGNPPFEFVQSHIKHAVTLTHSFEVISWIMPTSTPNSKQNANAMTMRPFGVWFPMPRVPYSGPGKTGRGGGTRDTSVFVINQSPPPNEILRGPWIPPLKMGRKQSVTGGRK